MNFNETSPTLKSDGYLPKSLSNKHKLVGIKIHPHVSWVDYDNFYNGFLPGGKSTQIQTGYVYLLLWLSEYLACKPVVVSVGWTYHPHTDLFHRHVSHLHKPQLSLFPFFYFSPQCNSLGPCFFQLFLYCAACCRGERGLNGLMCIQIGRVQTIIHELRAA